MTNKVVLLLVGRDDWQKDDALNYLLLSRMQHGEIDVAWEDPAARIIYWLRNLGRKTPWLSVLTSQINIVLIQLFYGLLHPAYFIYLRNRRINSIDSRCENLKKCVRKIQSTAKIVILAKSSGALAASLIADELNIQKLICIGYPFKHPRQNDEPERYRHLAFINTPMLIIQGLWDEYGGLEVKAKYQFNKNIELMFVKANHRYQLIESDVVRVIEKIEAIISGCNLK